MRLKRSVSDLARRFDIEIFLSRLETIDEDQIIFDDDRTLGPIVPLDGHPRRWNALGLLLDLIDPSRVWEGPGWNGRRRTLEIYDVLRLRYPMFSLSLIEVKCYNSIKHDVGFMRDVLGLKGDT